MCVKSVDNRICKKCQSNGGRKGETHSVYHHSPDGKKDLKFIYDPMDRRIAKQEYDDLTLADHLIYGSSRIGTETSDKLLTARIFTLTGGSLESAGDITEVSLPEL